ncbi:MAG TPA: O-antigen ligase family protein [Sedimentisphaerales bacterium]|nr:O-antigen ligase family protein [Sedimentisphaerales bacterium]HRS13313.1 O-antigen ligase family protein [Sedimentisphaerales bacterium]HRV49953.1 O-antigen ligase family protein [Sedimentisphaerales bacterium]
MGPSGMEPCDRLMNHSGIQMLQQVGARGCRARRLDLVIEILLTALLAFGPLAFGVVAAWSEQVVITLAAALVLAFLVQRAFLAPQPLVWTWAYVPVALFLLIAVLQLMPLPVSVVRAISPETAILKTQLLGDLPGADEALQRMRLTFYPHATKHDLRLALAIAAVFFVVVNVYRDPMRIKRLLLSIAIVAGIVGLLALAQDLVGNGRIYWIVPAYDRARSGTFINHSHFGQFMNLSIGATLALLLVLVYEAFADRRATPSDVLEYLRSSEANLVKLLGVAIVVGAAAVFVSLTRGGMVSMLVAAAVTTIVLSSRQSLRGRGWIIVLIALCAFVCVLWIGFDQVYDRMATLDDLTEYHGRWQMIEQSIEVWKKFPAFGAGLGTYEVVYPMFDWGDTMSLATHAENEYVQTLAETGAVGVLALAMFGLLVWVGYARCVRETHVPIRSAAYGLGFGLIAVLVHSLSDFGQHLPANAMLTAVCCALLIALTHLRSDVGTPADRSGRRMAMAFAPAVLLLVAAGGFGWALLGANAARVAEGHWNKAQLAARQMETIQWRSSAAAAEYLFRHAIAATEAEPDSIQYRHRLGVYMWSSLSPFTDPNTDALDAQAFPWARRIVEDLHRARPLCPTFGVLLSLAGQIERFALADPNGAAHIRMGYRLAPCNAAVCFAAARIDAEEARTEEAFEKLARAALLDGGYFARAAALCINDLARPDLALTLAGDNAGRLSQVADLLGASDRHGELAQQARTRAIGLLAERSTDSDAPASTHVSLARADVERGDVDSAIDRYRLALRKSYHQAGWHYELASLLARAGRAEEAMHEARICLRLRSNYAPAKRLVEELSTQPVEPVASDR